MITDRLMKQACVAFIPSANSRVVTVYVQTVRGRSYFRRFSFVPTKLQALINYVEDFDLWVKSYRNISWVATEIN